MAKLNISLAISILTNANGLKGIIDEARISNVARSEDEIAEAMSVGLQTLLPVEPDGIIRSSNFR